MPSFFDNETFEREVEEFISTGNASLIQVLVHNSIGLTKYYLSFMVTKINIMNIRLYGEYELKIQCLERYKEIFHKEMRSLRNEEDEELINSIDRSFDFVDKGITLDRVKLVKSFSKEGNEIKREIKKRLKENVFARLPETKEVEKSRYIADHRFFQGEKNITEYTNEIDITDLCSIDYEQILKIYDNFANKTIENMDKEIKDSVDNALERTMEMFSEKRDITVSEYKRCAGKIQQHYSFLKDIEKFTFLSQWYQELENTVAKTIDENIKNVLCPNEKNPPTTLIIAKLSNWFIVRVLHKLLHDKLVKLGKYEGLNFSQEVVELLEEKITRLDDRLLDPEKFVNAIRSALLHSNLTSSKPILSNMLIKEIKPDLSTQAQERLEKARVMANEVWEKDRNSPLCIESFIKVLLQELDNQISECKEEVYLRKLEENIIEEIRNEISKTKSEVFVRDITINALKQQKSTLVLALTIYTVTSYDVIEAGFNILDDMLTEAIKQDKEDLAMLLVCNGADINTRSVNGKTLSEELLTRPAFTEIARLYSSMPKIRARFTTENFERELEMINFITEQASSAKGEKVLDLHSIFTLKELCELLPKDTVFSKISSMLQNYKKEVSCKEDNSSVKLKRSSKQNKEQDSKQVNKTCENEQQSLEQVRKFFEKQEVKKLKVGWACGGGGAIVGCVGCVWFL
ncbi:MAG TPA: hypothetical protein DEQ74_02305 [Wolbachia sp.]|nr:hypothetical protein [Wolbachia sp.]